MDTTEGAANSFNSTMSPTTLHLQADIDGDMDNSSLPLELALELNLLMCKITMPPVVELVHAMSVEIMAIIAVAGSVTLATMFMFWRNYGEIKKRTPKEYFARTVVLCGLYQVRSGSIGQRKCVY